MKNTKLLIVLSMFMLNFSFPSLAKGLSAITYNCANGDRFGDMLCCYIHARWVSYQLQIPFLYKPFKFSEKLALHHMHEWFANKKSHYKDVEKFRTKGGYVTAQSLGIRKNAHILYELPFFPETRYDAIQYHYRHFDVGWNDEHFMNMLRNEIRPNDALPMLNIPSDTITVAVHARKGSGKDVGYIPTRSAAYFDVKQFPLRFPPDSYYIEHIIKLSEMFNDAPMYVYLFTDDKNPIGLMNRYKKAVNKPNITFDCRQELSSNPDMHVLEDFFNLTRFDCMIRADSHYSILAGHLGRYKVVIAPVAFVRHGDEHSITKTDIAIKDHAFVASRKIR